MSTPSPLAKPDFWNEVTAGYVSELVPLLGRFAHDALDLAAPPPGADVLDVAAGPGTLALLAARRTARVVAIDFADGMAVALGRRAAEEGLGNVEVHVGDGQALPFPDASFDAAFSMFGLMFFPDRAAGFRQLHRVLRPKGRAVVSAWAPLDRVPALAVMFDTLREALHLPPPPGALPLSDPGVFRGEMAAAGFAKVKIHEVAHPLTSPSARAFWESNVRGSAAFAATRRQVDAAAWEAAADEVVAALERAVGAGPFEVTYPALIGVGIR